MTTKFIQKPSAGVIPPGSVSNDALEDMSAHRIKGRAANSTGSPEDVPVDTTLVFPGDAALGRAAITGDVGVPQGSNTATIANDAVTNAKAANMPAVTLKANPTGGAADPQDITLGGGLDFSGTTLRRSALTGDVTSAAGSNTTVIADKAVTNAKSADMASHTVKARAAATDGVPEDVLFDTTLVFPGDNSIGRAAITGDVAIPEGSNTATISDGVVTLAKMADIASDRLFGRDTAGAGVPEAITVGGGIEFTGSGGIQTSAFTGDVTKAAGGTAQTVAANAVTNAKMAQMAATTLKANPTGAGADPQDITLNGTLSFSGTTLQRAALTGDVTAPAGSNTTTVAANVVTDAKFRQSAALSVVGRSANTTGNVADITAVTDGHVLRLSGTALGFGTLANAAFATNTVGLDKLANAAARYDIVGRKTAAGGAWEDCTRTQLLLAGTDLANVFTADQKIGSATGQPRLEIAGGNGVAEGGQLVISGGTAASVVFGNRSVILGGAYDSEPTLFSVVSGGFSVLNNAAARIFQLFNSTGASFGNLASPGLAGAVNATGFFVNGVNTNAIYAGLAAANTFLGTQTFDENGSVLNAIFYSDDPGSTGPVLRFNHDSASPAANDVIMTMQCFGRSSTAIVRNYAGWTAQIVSPTNGAEASRHSWTNYVAGTNTTTMRLGSGLYLGGATDTGIVGTVNVDGGYYVNSTVAIDSNALLRTRSYTVGTLPAASGVTGAIARVSDALAAPVYNAIATAGGSTVAKVFSDGTNWRYA